MRNEKDKKIRKKKVVVSVKKWLCLIVILVISLPLSGFSVSERNPSGGGQVDIADQWTEYTDWNPNVDISTDDLRMILDYYYVDDFYPYYDWSSDSRLTVDSDYDYVTDYSGEEQLLEWSEEWSESSSAGAIVISPSGAWSAPAFGGERRVTRTSAIPIDRVQRPTWANPTTFPSGNVNVLSVPPNPFSRARTGTYIFWAGNSTFQKSVTQAAGFIQISPSTAWSVSNAGGERTITRTSPLSIHTVNRPSWANPTTFPASGRTLLSVPPNPTSSARTGTFTFRSGEDLTHIMNVTQAAGTITISPSGDWNAPAGGGQRTLTRTSPISVHRVTRPSWANPTTFPSGGGLCLVFQQTPLQIHELEHSP